MKVFVIGGTGFTGPPLISDLLNRNHEVTFLHRGNSHDRRTRGAHEIVGDRNDQGLLTKAIESVSPEVVVDMIPFTKEHGESTVTACKGTSARIVALSSIEVYLAFGRIQGTEPGPLQPTPLTEESALRKTDQPGGPDCDKIAVERACLSDSVPDSTILRLPAIYGARDMHRRFRCYLKPMDDGREFILLGKSLSTWKFSRGYVDNVAHAIRLAIESDHSAGKIFNVAEPCAMKAAEFVRAIGDAAGWHGVKVLPDADLPRHLQQAANFDQNWDVDTKRIRTQLAYSEIVDTAEAFRRTVEWERNNPPETEPFDYDYEEEDKAILGCL